MNYISGCENRHATLRSRAVHSLSVFQRRHCPQRGRFAPPALLMARACSGVPTGPTASAPAFCRPATISRATSGSSFDHEEPLSSEPCRLIGNRGGLLCSLFAASKPNRIGLSGRSRVAWQALAPRSRSRTQTARRAWSRRQRCLREGKADFPIQALRIDEHARIAAFAARALFNERRAEAAPERGRNRRSAAVHPVQTEKGVSDGSSWTVTSAVGSG